MNRRSFCRNLVSLGVASYLAPSRAMSTSGRRSSQTEQTELLWDTYGIPHIFADSHPALFRAFGWAQMQSHANLILQLYGKARGRGAEYFGEDYIAGDKWILTNGVPALSRRMYHEQSPSFRVCLDAFVDGMNAYAREHPETISIHVKGILPLTSLDTLAHVINVIFYQLMCKWPFNVQRGLREDISIAPSKLTPESEAVKSGSNTWAVGPKRTKTGNALLLMNPHLPWSDYNMLYEAQLVAPGMNAYGAALVGFPVLFMGFNDDLGWSHTVNTLAGADLFELTRKADGYVYDGKARPFDCLDLNYQVKRKDGSLRSEKLSVQRSIHGPVVGERNGHPVALRVTGIDQFGMLEEWWGLSRARNLTEFQNVLRRLQIPCLTVMYADRDGHIMSLFNGRVPIRIGGDHAWGQNMPGDISKTLWTKAYSYDDLPCVIDPASGWLQNTNDPPWSTTFPLALDASRYPVQMAGPPGMSLRSQRSVKILESDPSLTLESFIEHKYSTRMELADRILDSLLTAARTQVGDSLKKAIAVLEKWDHTADNDSRGSTLFELFADRWLKPDGPNSFTMEFEGSSFAVPWTESEPLITPRGIADPKQAVAALEAAAIDMEQRYGSVDVPWGQVHRFRRGGIDLPANGAGDKLGVVRVIEYAKGKDGLLEGGADGDSFICAVEFRKSGLPRAMSLLNYGNSSQPDSLHQSDQLEFASNKQLRPVWRERAEIESHLESELTFK